MPDITIFNAAEDSNIPETLIQIDPYGGMLSLPQVGPRFPCLRSTMVKRTVNWDGSTGPLARLFDPTAHSIACSALLTLLARSASLVGSLTLKHVGQ